MFKTIAHTENTVQASASHPATEVNPLLLWASIAIFAAAGVLPLVAYYAFQPWLETQGYSPLVSFEATSIIFMSLYFAAALIIYHRIEGHPLTRSAFSKRMWYPKLRIKDFLWGIGIFLVGGIGVALLTPLGNWLFASGILPTPEYIPYFIDPRVTISPETLAQTAGGVLRGRYDILLLHTLMLAFNTLGEEFLWRGIVLPRQVKAHGRLAWLVHGVLWALFHVFKWWQIIVVAPMSLALSYVSQRLENNWPAFIAHFLGNISFWVIILLSVIG